MKLYAVFLSGVGSSVFWMRLPPPDLRPSFRTVGQPTHVLPGVGMFRVVGLRLWVAYRLKFLSRRVMKR